MSPHLFFLKTLLCFQCQLSPSSSHSSPLVPCSPKNTSFQSTHFLSLYYHFSPLHSMHPSFFHTSLLSSLSSPLAVPPWQRAWEWVCFLSRQPTAACPHCEQGKYAPLCLCGTHPSMWKWSECRLVNQSIEQTCLKPCPWNPSLLLFYAWQLS